MRKVGIIGHCTIICSLSKAPQERLQKGIKRHFCGSAALGLHAAIGELDESGSFQPFLVCCFSSLDWTIMVIPGQSSKTLEEPDLGKGTEREKTLKQFPPYGSMHGNSTGDTCPTCRGTGRIPRGWFSATKDFLNV